MQSGAGRAALRRLRAGPSAPLASKPQISKPQTLWPPAPAACRAPRPQVIVRVPGGRRLQIISSLVGRHNVYNILAAVAVRPRGARPRRGPSGGGGLAQQARATPHFTPPTHAPPILATICIVGPQVGVVLGAPLETIVAGIEAVTVIPGRCGGGSAAAAAAHARARSGPPAARPLQGPRGPRLNPLVPPAPGPRCAARADAPGASARPKLTQPPHRPGLRPGCRSEIVNADPEDPVLRGDFPVIVDAADSPARVATLLDGLRCACGPGAQRCTAWGAENPQHSAAPQAQHPQRPGSSGTAHAQQAHAQRPMTPKTWRTARMPACPPPTLLP
jgi:hypothetical protein